MKTKTQYFGPVVNTENYRKLTENNRNLTENHQKYINNNFVENNVVFIVSNVKAHKIGLLSLSG